MFVYWNIDVSLLNEAPCLCTEEHISPTARTTHTRTLHHEGLLCLRAHGEGRYVSGRHSDYPFPPLGINRKAQRNWSLRERTYCTFNISGFCFFEIGTQGI